MSEPSNRTSILCPLCDQRTTHVVCARCALTTAEERAASRAEVARLEDHLAKARRVILDMLPWLADGDESEYSESECGCSVCTAARAFFETMKGATDAAT